MGRARKSPRISELRKRFKPVFEEFKRFMKLLENFGNSSKVFSRCFYDFFKFSENLRKSSEVFGNLWKIAENFGNGSKVIFRCFYDFSKFSEILRKSLETILGCDRKCSQRFAGVERFRSLLLRSPQMDPSKLLRARNDRKVEWNTTRCILPVGYRRRCNGNPCL